MNEIYIILFVSILVSSYLYFKLVIVKKYDKLLSEQDILFKNEQSILTKQKTLQRKQLEIIKIESSILKEHIEKLKIEAKNDKKSKTFLLHSTRFLLIHMMEVNNYLVIKNQVVQESLKNIDSELITDLDREFINSLQSEIDFFEKSIISLNQYHFNITGELFIKKLTDPDVVKAGLISSLHQNKN